MQYILLIISYFPSKITTPVFTILLKKANRFDGTKIAEMRYSRHGMVGTILTYEYKNPLVR